MSNTRGNITLIGIEYQPDKILRFITNKESAAIRKKAVSWTRGPKLTVKGLSKRRNTTSRRAECPVCIETCIVYKCPNCTIFTCIDCIIQYCTTNEVYCCYSCKYEYTCLDISRMDWDRRTELFDLKYTQFMKIYDRYIPMTEKLIDISYEIEKEWNLTEEMGDALVFDEQPPPDTDGEWWSHIKGIWNQRTTHDQLLKTNYVDICSSCGGGISTDWKCVRCSSIMCNKCGICYEKQHKCSTADIESRMEVLENSKCCPHCNARIYKIEGCDIMWCTVCKIRFKWNTMEILNEVMHNPEHTSFLVQFYDGLMLRNPYDFFEQYLVTATIIPDIFSCRYIKSTTLERAVVSVIPEHIARVVNQLKVIHSRQRNSEIEPGKYKSERLKLVIGEWTKEEYSTAMKDIARINFLDRYYASYAEQLVLELIELAYAYTTIKSYSNELLYEQYCLKISAYNKDFCHICKVFYPDCTKEDVLYDLLYNNNSDRSYYSVDTGIIIPHKGVLDKDIYVRPNMKSILQ